MLNAVKSVLAEVSSVSPSSEQSRSSSTVAIYQSIHLVSYLGFLDLLSFGRLLNATAPEYKNDLATSSLTFGR